MDEVSSLLAEQMIGLFSVAFEDKAIRSSNESLDIAFVTDSGVLEVEVLTGGLLGELIWLPLGDFVGVVGLVLQCSLVEFPEPEVLPVLRDPADAEPLLPSWSPTKFWARCVSMSLIWDVRFPITLDEVERPVFFL